MGSHRVGSDLVRPLVWSHLLQLFTYSLCFCLTDPWCPSNKPMLFLIPLLCLLCLSSPASIVSRWTNSSFSSVQSLSRVQLFVTLWTTAHQASLSITNFPESTQTHVHWVSDAIQPSCPLSSPSPALNLSQHQGLFQWVSSPHQVAKVLEFQLQYQYFQWTSRTDLL